MRYFVPELTTVPPAEKPGVLASLFGKQPPVAELPFERLGGTPFGLSADRWPKCGECGMPLSLLAQLRHHPERLDLGRQGRTLLAFQCNHDPGMCATWERDSGANACLVLDADELTGSEVALPNESPEPDNAVFITGWHERDDGITPDEANAFFRDATYLALGETLWRQARNSTHLGGVPSWIQSADEAPHPGWRFLGQLDSTYSFLKPPGSMPSWVHADAERFEGRTHWGEGPNFGDGGIAYLFMRDNAEPPEVAMFWQCG